MMYKARQKDIDLTSPINQEFLKLAEAFGLRVSKERIDIYRSRLITQGITSDELKQFSEYWIWSETKFPALKDIKAFVDKRRKEDKEIKIVSRP